MDDAAAVQGELAAEGAAAAWETEHYEAARIADRGDQLQELHDRGILEEIEPREGEEAARAELACRAGSYIHQDMGT
ncbi:hypothetical protein AB0C97_26845 [Streptomyces goshikiensis]|uniref:hypothetical protein n=1 Tax=Streptomyces goshikiensis TaxID=1942 RepID=UPI0033EA0CEF